jgi:SAM-dependent methyltransferase
VSLKPVLLDRFADADLDPSPLIEPAATLLSMEPSFPLLGPAGYSGDLTHDTLSEYLPALSQPLVLAMLTGGVTHGSQLEDLLRDLRTALLDAAVHGHLEALPESVDELLVALATQAWLNEYLWSCSDEERQRVGRLGTEPRSRLVAACYRQLDAEDAALLAAHGSDRAQALIAEQIEAAAERDRIAADMPRLGGIVDETSLRVQAQYEVNPYPRLQRANRLTPRPLHYELTSALPAIDPDELPDSDHPAILIAGCGTGQHVVETATRYSGAEVTAIDLSAASLAFAQQRVQRMGLDVRFMQADILDLGELGERFDLIESAGVLHHMADPEAGWRVLTGLLADDGVMRIALYSELARRSVVTARGMFDPLPQTADEIRAARDQIRALPQDHPAFDVTSSRDFYSLSMCRDLLFHSQEHRFTIPELAATIDRLGLEFLGFELPPGVGEAYKARFPDDPTMRDLSNWDAFEQTEPGTFGAMYQFLVRRR